MYMPAAAATSLKRLLQNTTHAVHLRSRHEKPLVSLLLQILLFYAPGIFQKFFEKKSSDRTQFLFSFLVFGPLKFSQGFILRLRNLDKLEEQEIS